jgi:Uma2 family endonuclease
VSALTARTLPENAKRGEEDEMPVSEQTYQAVAVEDPERHWELYDGLLVEKPWMGIEHSDVKTYLGFDLIGQLDREKYRVHIDSTRLRETQRRYFIPDVTVIPIALFRRGLGHPGRLEFYNEPMPFVAEIWSQSTGRFDVDEKLPAYRRRGDLEIWRLHPYERTLTVWRRQPDGTYDEAIYHREVVEIASLPGVTIDLDALFDFR